jgi:AraC-like DNA-binding protein
MSPVTRAPHPALRALVAGHYAARAVTLEPGRPVSMPARASLPVYLTVDEPPHDYPGANLAGPGGLYQIGGDTTAPAPLSWVGLRLAPLGAYRVLAQPLDALRGRRVGLREAFGADGVELVEKIRSVSDWDDRFTLVEDFLFSRAAAGPDPSREVTRAWRLLTAASGQIRIADVAREVGWSQSRLARGFRREIGLGPKTAARLVRLHRLLPHVPPGGAADWTRLAAEHGYYDQAHLHRDFHEFLGTTPARFATRRTPLGNVYSRPAALDSSKTAAAATS